MQLRSDCTSNISISGVVSRGLTLSMVLLIACQGMLTGGDGQDGTRTKSSAGGCVPLAYHHVTPADIGKTVGVGALRPAPTVTYSGPMTITSPTEIKDRVIDGCLTILSAGVVLENVDIQCAGRQPLVVDGGGGKGFKLSHSRVACTGTPGNNARQAAIMSNIRGAVITNTEIVGCMRGIFFDAGDMSGFQYSNNVYHKQLHDGATHTEAFFVGLSGTVTGKMQIRGSYFSRTPNNASTDTLFTPDAKVNMVIESNYFGIDSWYTLRCSATTTCTVRYNIFDRSIDGSNYSAAKLDSPASSFSCNRWDDDGSLVPSDEVVGASAMNSDCPAPPGTSPQDSKPSPPDSGAPEPDSGVPEPDTAPPPPPPPPSSGPYVTPADVGKTVGHDRSASYTTFDGELTVTQDGAVIQNKIINGCLVVRANNVTVRNVQLNFVPSRCSTPYFFLVEDSSGLKVERSTIDCHDIGSGDAMMAGRGMGTARDWVWDHVEAKGCNISFYMIGSIGHSAIKNSVIHQFSKNNHSDSISGAHTEFLRLQAIPPGDSITVTGSYIPYDRNPGCCQTGLVFNTGGTHGVDVTFSDSYIGEDWQILFYGSSVNTVLLKNAVLGKDGAQFGDGLSTVMLNGGGTVSCLRYAAGGDVPASKVNAASYSNSGCPAWMP